MAGWVSPLVRACCFALLALIGCQGTQHQLFGEIVPPVIERQQPLRDASVPPTMEEAGAGGGAAPEAGSSPELGPPPDPDLNPDVTFPWTETLPGKGTCRKGLYIGSFSCKADEGIEGLLPWTGQVVLVLEGSEEKQVLKITNGKLADDLFPVFLGENAMLEGGRLECLNGYRLEARLTGDTLTFKKFETTFVGWLDPETLVIKGGFQLTTPADLAYNCSFQANAAP